MKFAIKELGCGVVDGWRVFDSRGEVLDKGLEFYGERKFWIVPVREFSVLELVNDPGNDAGMGHTILNWIQAKSSQNWQENPPQPILNADAALDLGQSYRAMLMSWIEKWSFNVDFQRMDLAAREVAQWKLNPEVSVCIPEVRVCVPEEDENG